MPRTAWIMGFVLMAVAGAMAEVGEGTAAGEWPSYGADLASTKYSPLDQIDGENFEDLQVVWRWTSVDGWLSKTEAGGEWWGPAEAVFEQLLEEDPELWRRSMHPRMSSLKATPLMINGVLYLCTPLYQAAAIDAATGETLWVYNPKSYESGTPTMSLMWNHRGVAYWTDGEDDERIYWGTGDGYLIAVDAKTGRPCPNFGNNGRVDMTVGIPRAPRGGRDELNALLFSSASPPIVCRDVVVTGSSISDYRVVKETPPGDVRGWDARTGELLWTFHTIPRDGEFGVETWENDSHKYTGNANVWTQMSSDEELGYVYLPTGTPSNDFYGGHRHGDNLFAESLICVDVETGERVWHFQAVHHGLWDYDLPCAPSLVDITVDGKEIPALAQTSKHGFTYVFNRVTGEPVWPIEERTVPETDMPGEKISPTQPFPTKPAPYAPQGVSIDDLIDFTPELRAKAVEAVNNFRLGPLFTPPRLGDPATGREGTIQRPGLGGAVNWGGSGVDPETGVLYVPSRDSFTVTSFYTPDPKVGGTVRYTHARGGGRPERPDGLPLFKPPYSTLTAIDLNTGEHRWQVPLGEGPENVLNHPELKDMNLPPLGGDRFTGPLITKTLVILGQEPPYSPDGSDRPARLVAYDKVTGDVVGAVELPRNPIGTPMTYMLDDKQYIALTIEGGPPQLITLALP